MWIELWLRISLTKTPCIRTRGVTYPLHPKKSLILATNLDTCVFKFVARVCLFRGQSSSSFQNSCIIYATYTHSVAKQSCRATGCQRQLLYLSSIYLILSIIMSFFFNVWPSVLFDFLWLVFFIVCVTYFFNFFVSFPNKTKG